MNEVRSEAFDLSRSIRKDFPLAPSLFVIIADALYYRHREKSLSPRVKGIELLNEEDISNVQFVDDTTITIELAEDNVFNLMNKLDLFSIMDLI